MKTNQLGNTGISVPPIIFGSSALGNLYQALPYEKKLEIAREWFAHVTPPVAIDSAGKYGAGLALEMIGKTLADLGIAPDDAVISNKLAWKRVPMIGDEPTFERGVWEDIDYDAEQSISYEGIIECFEQGCELLGGTYAPRLSSVHDPDEYLSAATDAEDRAQRLQDVKDAYRALNELKAQGKTSAVGIGSKDWTAIREIASEVELDWVMFACNLTPYTHSSELLTFMAELNERGTGMINSAVFNAGFLTGGKFFDYRVPDPDKDAKLFEWRDKFEALCAKHEVQPAAACVQFGMSVPGVIATALNTARPERIKQNVELCTTDVPMSFWTAMKDERLVDREFPYLA